MQILVPEKQGRLEYVGSMQSDCLCRTDGAKGTLLPKINQMDLFRHIFAYVTEMGGGDAHFFFEG